MGETAPPCRLGAPVARKCDPVDRWLSGGTEEEGQRRMTSMGIFDVPSDELEPASHPVRARGEAHPSFRIILTDLLSPL